MDEMPPRKMFRKSWFENVRFPGDWELNVGVGPVEVRVGRSQLALWWDYHPLLMWLRPSGVSA